MFLKSCPVPLQFGVMPQFLAEPEDHGTIAQSASGNRQNVLFFGVKRTFIKKTCAAMGACPIHSLRGTAAHL
jgi:hypothetical protein